jgi:hypothetical protein
VPPTMPRLPLTPRAAATTSITDYATLSITKSFTTYTTEILLGNPTTEPDSSTFQPNLSSGPSRSTIIGAVVGSILGFLLILALIFYCTTGGNSNWVPSDFDGPVRSIYVSNPDMIPMKSRPSEMDDAPSAQVVQEGSTLYFIRPKIKKKHRPISGDD